MTRYMAAVDGMTNLDDAAFMEFLKEKNVDWWHWLPGVWMMISDDDKISTEVIRDKLRDITGRKHSVIIEVSEHGDWSGFGPTTTEKNMFKWLHDKWD